MKKDQYITITIAGATKKDIIAGLADQINRMLAMPDDLPYGEWGTWEHRPGSSMYNSGHALYTSHLRIETNEDHGNRVSLEYDRKIGRFKEKE